MSQRTALYRLFNAQDELLYVGISWRRLPTRMRDHAETQPWWEEVDHATAAWYPSHEEADEAETEAIKAERPKYNIMKTKPPKAEIAAQKGVIPGRRLPSYRIKVRLRLENLAGETFYNEPPDMQWLRTKLADPGGWADHAITMTVRDQGLAADEAIRESARWTRLYSFRRNEQGCLCWEARVLESKLRAVIGGLVQDGHLPVGRDGRKAGRTLIAEEYISLGVTEPTAITPRYFLGGPTGTGVLYEESVADAEPEFTVATDRDFTDSQWEMIWAAFEEGGLDYGRFGELATFKVIAWG